MNDIPVLYCVYCGFKGEREKYYWKCPACGSPLEFEYEGYWNPSGIGLSRYSTCLPIPPSKSLGEGNTPLVEVEYKGVKVKFKLEYLNPSGSFKDRGTLLALELASRLGYRRVVEDTSGNTGISIAMYSRVYGLKATIVMPRYAPRGKKVLVKALGANVIETPSRGDAAIKVLGLLGEDVYYVAHTWSPLYIEGAKTIAYESHEQGFNGNIVIAPVGSGGLFLGLYRGFKELRAWGLVKEVPRFIAVEGVSVTPLYSKLYGEVKVKGDSSLADGIMVPSPPRLNELVNAVKETKGLVVLVDNNDIVKAMKELYEYGFIVEPTSATPYACLKKLIEGGIVKKGDEVLIPLTGSGLKTIDIIEKYVSSN